MTFLWKVCFVSQNTIFYGFLFWWILRNRPQVNAAIFNPKTETTILQKMPLLLLNWKGEYFPTIKIPGFYLPTNICMVGENLSRMLISVCGLEYPGIFVYFNVQKMFHNKMYIFVIKKIPFWQLWPPMHKCFVLRPLVGFIEKS